MFGNSSCARNKNKRREKMYSIISLVGKYKENRLKISLRKKTVNLTRK